jgi:hypothetical protein
LYRSRQAPDARGFDLCDARRAVDSGYRVAGGYGFVRLDCVGHSQIESPVVWLAAIHEG